MTKAPSGAPAQSRSAPKAGAAASGAATAPAISGQPTPAEQPGHARIIAIANQKGGVGKSTTAVSLGAALADLGYRVLVVDLDPQGNASTGLGIRHDARATTVYDVVVGEAPLERAVVKTAVHGLDAIPSTIDLAGAEIELVSQFSRESRLKKALEPVRDGVYDFVFLDCPPSLGLLTVNALTAAEELIVPIQCEYYALEGLGQLLRNVNLVQQNINPGLRLTGIVMTMFDSRTKLSEQVVAEVRRFFGDLVYDVIIPRTVRLSEAPGFGQPITVYDPRSKGAETYRDLANEVALRPPPETPMPSYDDLPNLAMTPLADPSTASPEMTEEASVTDHEEEHGPVGGEPEAGPELIQELPPNSASGRSSEDPTDVAVEDVAEAEQLVQAAARPPSPPARTTSPRPKIAPTPSPPEEDIWEHEPADPTPLPQVGDPAERRVVVIDDDRDIDIRAGREPLGNRSGGPAREDPQHEAVAPIGATLEDAEGGRRRRWRLFRKGGEG